MTSSSGYAFFTKLSMLSAYVESPCDESSTTTFTPACTKCSKRALSPSRVPAGRGAAFHSQAQGTELRENDSEIIVTNLNAVPFNKPQLGGGMREQGGNAVAPNYGDLVTQLIASSQQSVTKIDEVALRSPPTENKSMHDFQGPGARHGAMERTRTDFIA